MALYLVTGAAGFIGRSIAQQLLAGGAAVRGIDNFSTGKRGNLVGLEGMEFIEGDITDPAAVGRACDGVEVVFHEAALASVPRSVADPLATNHANVTGTLQLLQAAHRAGVRRVIYAGSSSAYGDTPTLPKNEEMLANPISPYAVSKLTGEYYLRSMYAVHGMETVTIRYFNVFGPYQDPGSQYSGVLAKFIPQMLRGETPTIHGDGEQSRDFTYIENVVKANIALANAPAERVAGEVFNVATGTRISLNETVALLREMTGYTGAVHHGPERKGDVKHSLADISKAKRAFGFEPTVMFPAGLHRTVEWYRKALAEDAVETARK
ncbi:NAD-dependent epimerase/dehydratase [Candidatus Koribacter versatilis Ellin345]|uniref:NAD-dependent epimerase/dehydratase n=1 Tax=Koribacter versatilis (strain Ellin345) TaxID=204669 RepID=Q1IM02_KORVE|nr:SDR family oxidoreductase [Candidatus Koribacter versatilis]ABF42098.1 NAD-dependent epimerase/dehydratase [Candidatus Koribacter versatilis Ellin345]